MEAAGGIDLEHGSHRLAKAGCLGKIKFFGQLVDPKLVLTRAQPYGPHLHHILSCHPFGALCPTNHAKDDRSSRYLEAAGQAETPSRHLGSADADCVQIPNP
jgi:hypothetical protein